MISARRFSDFSFAVLTAILTLQLVSSPVSASLLAPIIECDGKPWHDEATALAWDWSCSTPSSSAPAAPAAPLPEEVDQVFKQLLGSNGNMGAASQSQTVTSGSVASVLNQLSVWQFVPAIQESSVCLEDLPPPDPPVAELLKVPICRIAI
jgi:hypothetical protein